jgi:sugar O-acyltransferase (sialic acid O-acetyltransferase NeuD family)
MKKLIIVGAGGFGREVQMLVDHVNDVFQQWNLIGFIDDGFEQGTIINDLPVIGPLEELNKQPEDCWVVLAIGDPAIKQKIIDRVSGFQIRWATLIHPSVIMGNPQYVSIGEGSIICAGSILTTQVKIGKHVILNLVCTVGHDVLIGDYSSFMPAVNISGEVKIGEGVYVGTGAKINNKISIGSGSIIGSGAVVVHDIPQHCTAVGIPAKPIKFKA